MELSSNLISNPYSTRNYLKERKLKERNKSALFYVSNKLESI